MNIITHHHGKKENKMSKRKNTIDDVKKIKLEENEYLMIRLPDNIQNSDIDHLGITLKKVFGDNFSRIFIYSGEMDMRKVVMEQKKDEDTVDIIAEAVEKLQVNANEESNE
jgi:hypothetical protein